MDKVWSSLDLSENLGRCLSVVRRMSGLQAVFMAAMVFLMMLASGALAWTFDITTTLNATDSVIGAVASSMPYQLVDYVKIIVLAITVSPTLFELGGSAFAKEGSTPFQGAVIALSIFDMVTDAPAVTAFLLAQWNFFEGFGILAHIVLAASWVLWLVGASFFFEMVTICLFVSLIGLLLRSFGGKGSSIPSMASRIHGIDA